MLVDDIQRPSAESGRAWTPSQKARLASDECGGTGRDVAYVAVVPAVRVSRHRGPSRSPFNAGRVVVNQFGGSPPRLMLHANEPFVQLGHAERRGSDDPGCFSRARLTSLSLSRR